MAEDPLTTHARNRLGRVLRGKWTLDRIIGVGGMAAVYEATHRNGSKVAIKILHPTLMYDTNFAHRLIQEGYVANKINHPAAVKVMDDDTDETDGAVFLVMELLEGMTLSQARRKRKKFPPVEACRLMEPVLECLGNAHALGIIHRDIKPENLFLTKDGTIRVLDFGIARVSDSTNVSATRTGMVVGSPAYMAPEQAIGKMNAVGPQTDVYAVGATLFALITGTTPHAGETTQEMIVMVATQSARPILTVAPDVPPPIARVIDRALAYDREKRYPDARAMLDDLHAALAEVEGLAPSVLPTFADDDDEGQTTVSNALPEKPAAPLPAAGLNRVGLRPATGRFEVRPPSAPPVAAASSPNVPPSAPPVAAVSSPNVPPSAPPVAAASSPNVPPTALPRRPPTLAPTGAPMPRGVPIAPLGPSPEPVGSQSGPHALPNPTQEPGHRSAPGNQPAPFPSSPTSSLSGASSNVFDPLQVPVDTSVPPTMAMPMLIPGDLVPMPGTTSGQHPGVSSGQRPGATTNMAWAAPPELSPVGEPAPQKPKAVLFAAAAVAVLGLGLGGYFVLSGSNNTQPQPAQAHTTTTRPPTSPRPVALRAPSEPSPEQHATPPGSTPSTPGTTPSTPETTPGTNTVPVRAQGSPSDTPPHGTAAEAPEAPPAEVERNARPRPRPRERPSSNDNRNRNRNRNRNNNPLGY